MEEGRKREIYITIILNNNNNNKEGERLPYLPLSRESIVESSFGDFKREEVEEGEDFNL